jgi:predicted ATPase
MLEFLHIFGFKSLNDSSFELSNLNLFTGLNGMGKSSLIQTLLLLRQSHKRNALSQGLLLKGDLINLGVGKDVLSEQSENDRIEFLVKWNDIKPVRFSFDYVQDSDFQPISGAAPLYPTDVSLFSNNFQYLSADRIGPKSQYEISNYDVSSLNSLGIHGEYSVQYIAEFGAKSLVIDKLNHPNSKADTFQENLNAWMSEITPGVQIFANKIANLGVATLGYSFLQGNGKSKPFIPQNVGFGLTYVLPVVTAILRARPGDLVIIENPESHLHPAGQSAVGRLCSLAAAAGVQLILESHSDHFLNGIRIAAKESAIDHEKICIYYLDRSNDSDENELHILKPNLDKDGRIDNWPKGFFDQWDNSLEKLL